MNGENEQRQQGQGGQQEFPRIPQFGKQNLNGWGKKAADWFDKNFTSVILPIIALIIVGTGIYLYNRQAIKETPKTAQEVETQESESQTTDTDKEKFTITEVNEEVGSVQGGPEATAATNGNYIEKAEKGEGVTHLARKSVKRYLQEIGDNISAEQKIYAEDYIKDRIGSRGLKLGQVVEISKDLAKESVEKSRQLSEKQIKNLTKYVKSVPSLNK